MVRGNIQWEGGEVFGAPTMHLLAHKVGGRLRPNGPRQPEGFVMLPDPHQAIAPTAALHKHLQVACRGHMGTHRGQRPQRSDKGLTKCLTNYSISKGSAGAYVLVRLRFCTKYRKYTFTCYTQRGD